MLKSMTNLSTAITVSVPTDALNENIVMNCANGQRIDGNTQRLNMKSVNVNGIENNAINISETDKLIKNFFNSREERLPTISTIIDMRFPLNDINDVNKYNEVINISFQLSQAGRGSNLFE
jgi:hypothetical protein